MEWISNALILNVQVNLLPSSSGLRHVLRLRRRLARIELAPTKSEPTHWHSRYSMFFFTIESCKLPRISPQKVILDFVKRIDWKDVGRILFPQRLKPIAPGRLYSRIVSLSFSYTPLAKSSGNVRVVSLLIRRSLTATSGVSGTEYCHASEWELQNCLLQVSVPCLLTH